MGSYRKVCAIGLLVFGTGAWGLASAQVCVPPPQGLIGWWPGDGTGDDIVLGNDGSLVGGAGFGAGKVAQGFSLDGVDDYVDAGTPVPLDAILTGDFTIDAWVKYDDVGAGRQGPAVTRGDGGSSLQNRFIYLGVHDSGLPFFQVRGDNGEGSSATILAGPGIATGTWYHLAGVREKGTAVRLFVDGVEVGSAIDNAGALTFGAPRPLLFGAWQVGLGGATPSYTHGIVDEVEVFDRALAPSEINGLFAAGAAGKCKYTTVSIDIKPGSSPNSINLGAAGTVPVAILGSASFDATQVDPSSVSLAGAAVKLIGKGGKYACSADDVNGDARLDLVCHVVTAQFMIEPGDSVAVLEARTFGGAAIRGEDSIRIVPD